MSDEMKFGLSIAGSLLLIIWGMMRQEAKRTDEALDKKASSAALDEAKATHRVEINQLRDFFQERIRELNQRQDREIDWLKEEMGRIASSLSEMRQEQIAANAQITQNIQQLTITLQRGRRADP